MRKQIIFFIFLGGLAVSLLVLIIFLFRVEVPGTIKREQHDRLSIQEMERLQEGDIIMRKGFGHVSSSIVNLLKEKYPVSHCGIIVKDTNGRLSVIHAVSSGISGIDGVQACSIENFCKEAMVNTIIVSRYKHAEPKRIGEQARFFLDRKISFDNEFDFKDDSQLYCNEMVWKSIYAPQDSLLLAFTSINELDQKKFSYFWSEKQFEVLINHFE